MTASGTCLTWCLPSDPSCLLIQRKEEKQMHFRFRTIYLYDFFNIFTDISIRESGFNSIHTYYDRLCTLSIYLQVGTMLYIKILRNDTNFCSWILMWFFPTIKISSFLINKKLHMLTKNISRTQYFKRYVCIWCYFTFHR